MPKEQTLVKLAGKHFTQSEVERALDTARKADLLPRPGSIITIDILPQQRLLALGGTVKELLQKHYGTSAELIVTDGKDTWDWSWKYLNENSRQIELVDTLIP